MGRKVLAASYHIFETISDALIVLASDGTIVYLNHRAEVLLRQDRDELLETKLWQLVPEWQPQLEPLLNDPWLQQRGSVIDLLYPLTQRWMGLRMTRAEGATFLVFTDVTDSKRAKAAREKVHHTIRHQMRHQTHRVERLNEQLLYDSLHDALTGLPNRTYLMDILRRAISDSETTYALLFLDFDGFKLINDTLGHRVGDKVLIALGERIQAMLRTGDTVVRLGGDEFTVLLSDVATVQQVKRALKRLQQAFVRPFEVQGYELYLSASIGVVHDLSRYASADDILRDADIAMYQAKQQGRGNFILFDSELRDKLIERMQLEADLRSVLANGELQVNLQVIMDLATRLPTGFEALVRWHHPRRGVIPPDDFIPIAEDIGIITDIDFWVLEQAARAFIDWRQSHDAVVPLRLNVNFSSKHFARSDMAEKLRAIFARTGLAPEQLNIELTETLLMDNTLHTQRSLRRLRELGVQLLIDDFGTGYSSLSYLKRFSAHGIKIDKSFIQDLDDPKNIGLIRSLVAMAHTLGMSVTAEGVETLEQYQLLQMAGCDYAQGYHISRPLPISAAEALLRFGTVPQGRLSDH